MLLHGLVKFVKSIFLKFLPVIFKFLHVFLALCKIKPSQSLTKIFNFVEAFASDIELNCLCLLKLPTLQNVDLIWTSVFCAAVRNHCLVWKLLFVCTPPVNQPSLQYGVSSWETLYD